MPKRTKSKTFGTRAGRGRPSSQVTVYVRADLPDRVFLSRAWLKTPSGESREEALPAGTTWDDATFIAQQAAIAREAVIRGHAADARRVERITVGQLLHRYHESREADDWRDRHAYDQERYRKLWELAIGEQHVDEVSPDQVESVARRWAKQGKWSDTTERRVLQYLKTAGKWGAEKAELIPRGTWMAVSLPRPNRLSEKEREDRTYTDSEIQMLATPHEEIDYRVTLHVSIEYDTGHRGTSVLHIWRGHEDDPFTDPDSDLRVLDVPSIDPETGKPTGTRPRMFVRFRAEFDKGDQDLWRPVSEATRQMIEVACERHETRTSGWLFPEGALDRNDPRDKPILLTSLIRKLHDAEDVLGIERVPYRGTHGVKRRHVSSALESAGGDLSLVGKMTGNRDLSLLQNTYFVVTAARFVDHVDGIRKRLEEDPSDD